MHSALVLTFTAFTFMLSAVAAERKPNVIFFLTDDQGWWAEKDTDKNGQLSLDEYLRNYPDKAEGQRRFPLFDRDGSGLLSKQEFMTPPSKLGN